MTQSLRFEGRWVFLRLSDVPENERLLAAEQLVAVMAKGATSPLDALVEATLIRAVAEDPWRAATEMPEECENKVFSVPVDEYLRVVNGVEL